MQRSLQWLAGLYSVGAHGIMTLNDFKSVEGDRRMGIGSLPVRLGDRSMAGRVACAWSWRCRSSRSSAAALSMGSAPGMLRRLPHCCSGS
jgi:4-hydroxybenzoate polyprenyltransferase